jgi:hypothetical protein
MKRPILVVLLKARDGAASIIGDKRLMKCGFLDGCSAYSK